MMTTTTTYSTWGEVVNSRRHVVTWPHMALVLQNKLTSFFGRV